MGAPREFWSLHEIADIANVTTSTVYVWRHRGLLPDPAITIANSPGWEPAVIVAWLAERNLRPHPQRRARKPRPQPGAETGFEREMRLAREAAQK